MKDRKIDRLFIDLDGCFNAGPDKGGDIVFPKVPPFDWKPELPNILEFRKFRDFYGLSCHAVTGRSVKASEALLQLFTNAPSVVEHGTIIYDPRDVVRERHLIEADEKYHRLKEAKEELEFFIANTAPNLIARIQHHFPEHTMRMLFDNLHIWTIEIRPTDLKIAKKLKELVNELVLPVNIIRHIENGHLKELVSNVAYDLMPAVSKKIALESLIRVKKINVSTSLGIGDSFHSDDWLKIILEKGGVIGCPANADERLKELVGDAGERGFVAKESYFEGSKEILEHFIGPFK